jgi:hypothetical protein
MFACGLTISSRGKERKEKKKNKIKGVAATCYLGIATRFSF